MTQKKKRTFHSSIYQKMYRWHRTPTRRPDLKKNKRERKEEGRADIRKQKAPQGAGETASQRKTLRHKSTHLHELRKRISSTTKNSQGAQVQVAGQGPGVFVASSSRPAARPRALWEWAVCFTLSVSGVIFSLFTPSGKSPTDSQRRPSQSQTPLPPQVTAEDEVQVFVAQAAVLVQGRGWRPSR